jgi:hypothetical protein
MLECAYVLESVLHRVETGATAFRKFNKFEEDRLKRDQDQLRSKRIENQKRTMRQQVLAERVQRQREERDQKAIMEKHEAEMKR